jgi:hypothetical protein
MCAYLVSCNDNSVVINEQPFSFDSARFNVSYIQSPFDLSGAYVTDTDKILLYDYYGYAYYKNGAFIFRTYNINFYPTSNMDGINENNVYLGGFERIYDNLLRYKLLKWNGTDFENIQMSDTASGIQHKFASVFCKSPNEIWLGGRDGTAWKYDGVKFIKYIIDTNYVSSNQIISLGMLTDGNNNLCCVYLRDSSNYNETAGIRYFKFYKFNNNNGEFDLLSSIRYKDQNGSYGPSTPRRIGNKMYTVSSEGLFEFDGYTFTKITDIGPIIQPYPYVAGTGPNDIMISGRTENNSKYSVCLFNWNGIKWSKEDKVLSHANGSTYLIYINNMYICVDYMPPYFAFIKFLKRN